MMQANNLQLKTKSAARRKPIGRILLLAGLLLLTALLFSFLRYQPALRAAPGYTVHHVTNPGWLNGRFKSIQAITEQIPCTYTLLGWQEDKAFYYQSTCADAAQTWRYTLNTTQAEKITTAPDALYAVSVPVSTIVDGLLVNVSPSELATVSRQTFIAGEPLVSENGRYTALVSRHVYGPQDILILSPDTFP